MRGSRESKTPAATTAGMVAVLVVVFAGILVSTSADFVPTQINHGGTSNDVVMQVKCFMPCAKKCRRGILCYMFCVEKCFVCVIPPLDLAAADHSPPQDIPAAAAAAAERHLF
ncbi:hypothetical protein Nepgr_019510 [Nepenthes gracilis]|uniref:Uncharacterized protein n=1 Tax=Nepenthes gracilis TaxID=150966 RepID=A0AAD3XV41_NEPGR|nr:hypothetical protein Nepgr_019510 [Nepenthes gracilis]